ncbi:hypothetical protein NSE_0920 [Neorickettsia sennetsu str. Miyayama]|uniref:Uncharacterized protein n=1 Tax=Ehrlichia sennetsu (strain ATCC VR-367 / Miyayama) TaxID=222891 RepID=Q2GCL2_EHRS3|nr:hypothetical protein NSE_0920 [Neorickettsia sennetsu str. Miyayama]
MTADECIDQENMYHDRVTINISMSPGTLVRSWSWMNKFFRVSYCSGFL